MFITRVIQFSFLIVTATMTFGQDRDVQLANEYYQQGEIEKAKTLYDELSTNRRNIAIINSNYLEVLKQIGEPKEVEKYFDRVLKWYPGNISYLVDEATYYFQRNDLKEFGKRFDALKEYFRESRFQLSMIAQQFASNRMYQQSVEMFMLARDVSGSASSYALELARIYSFLNDKESMVEEYLTYAQESRQNTNYIKNIFQNLLKDEDDLSFLENSLIRRMQENPDDRTFPDLMIWLELQRQNFFGAFLQARALDKREESTGGHTRRVGQIALDNESWEDAITIFEYLTRTYQDQSSQAYYRRMLIQAKEGKVKNKFPIDKGAIKNLSREYSRLFKEVGPNKSTYEALRNMAHLHAFYLGEIDTASIVLRYLIDSPRAGKNIISQCKLDLGDIYILRNQPWEATLLYSQVEKAHRDSPLAYEAKLKNARLHYFTGNFALAKSHLDILKRATTREISNDAIDLTVLISDNTYLDSTDVVMQTYASIDLMIFQNQFGKAQRALEHMLVDHPNHSITDEVYWRLAEIHERAGRFIDAIEYLEKIALNYGFDILADDAQFKIALITEEQLGDLSAAQEMYREFMTDHPGSSYTAEARNRFRKLRGDYDS